VRANLCRRLVHLPPRVRAGGSRVRPLLVSAQFRGSTISPDLIMLPRMSATESNTLDRILKLHEDELVEKTLS
jgi:hypothetical protein